MPLFVALLLLFAVVGSLVYLIRRTQRLDADFDRFMQQRKFSALASCPAQVEHPFVYPELRTCVAYEGPLSPGNATSPSWVLILGSRQREGAIGNGNKIIVDRYVGVYVPSRSLTLDDAWLLGWQKKVAERGDGWAKQTGLPVTEREHGLLGPAESMPIRAVRTKEGGVLIAWHCLHLADRLEKRLTELTQTLPQKTQDPRSP